MNTAAFAKLSLEQAFGLLGAVLKDTPDDQYNFDPPGTANAAAKTHVHIVSAVDFFINSIVGGGTPSWGAFAAEHGLPANPTEIWTHTGAIALDPMREWTNKVNSSALEVVSKLSDGDFDTVKDTPMFGKQTVAFLVQLAALHTNGHTGDIATIKGVQGVKGLPF